MERLLILWGASKQYQFVKVDPVSILSVQGVVFT